MPIKTEDQLSARTRELYEQARDAADRGEGNRARELLFEVISQEPEFLEAHRLLHMLFRETRRRDREKPTRALLKTITGMFAMVSRLGLGWAMLKQEKPSEAMIHAYHILSQDPTNTQGLDLLIRAAQQMELYEVAALAAEVAVAASPHNLVFLHTLAELYRRAAQLPLGLFEQVFKANRSTGPEEEDWELYVAFIRFDFPPNQRDIAQKLAAAFASVVGKRIIHLRPECKIGEVLSWAEEEEGDENPLLEVLRAFYGRDTEKREELDALDLDSLDRVELLMSFEEEFAYMLPEMLPERFLDLTFRELVEHFAAKESVKA